MDDEIVSEVATFLNEYIDPFLQSFTDTKRSKGSLARCE
jgi:hypothetical protein